MKNCKTLIAAALALVALTSCNKAVIKGSFAQKPASDVLVAKIVEGSSMRTLDSIKIAKDGSFKYAPKVEKGQPEFYYLYYGDAKVASLVLDAGDKVKVSCDTLGRWTVEGSKDCELLREWEMEQSEIISRGSISLAQYVEYYRKMTKFVIQNSHSITVVPVLFSKIGDTPVFSQLSDAIIFTNVADSLETVYPKSKYLASLRMESVVRYNQLQLNTLIQNASEASYVDLNFDGVEGAPVVLSEVAGKATLLVFWNAADPANKMFNQEVLKPVYDKYASKGLQIYQVNLVADKATWGMVVSEQGMPWVNVCDVYGKSINAYGVTEIPTVYILANDLMTRLNDISLGAVSAAVAKALK